MEVLLEERWMMWIIVVSLRREWNYKGVKNYSERRWVKKIGNRKLNEGMKWGKRMIGDIWRNGIEKEREEGGWKRNDLIREWEKELKIGLN